MKFRGRTATAIIPFQKDKILLIKRTTPPFVDYWALPGGRMEEGEKVEQTIVREVKEETGLEVEIVRKVGEYHEKGIESGYEYDYYPACFLVRRVGGKLQPQRGEIAEVEPFKLAEIPEPLAFLHSQMVRDYVAQESQKGKVSS